MPGIIYAPLGFPYFLPFSLLPLPSSGYLSRLLARHDGSSGFEEGLGGR
jgi:hypothetical protein